MVGHSAKAGCLGKGTCKYVGADWSQADDHLPRAVRGQGPIMTSFIYPKPGSVSTVYVGGFDQSIDESKLWSIFETFGEIREIFLPRDQTVSGLHKGFGFVELAEENDAKSAIDNLHMNQFFGQTFKCNLARPSRIVVEGVGSSSAWEGHCLSQSNAI